MIEIVLDTNVFVSALRSDGGAARQVLRKALQGIYRPVFGNALWLEYEDLMSRDVWTPATTAAERVQVLAALARMGRWVTVHYGWRPNLPDEGDNHLIELAVAANARAIVTHNVRDVARGELIWNELRVVTPAQCLETTHEHPHHTPARQHRRPPQVTGQKPWPERQQTDGRTQRAGAGQL